MEEGSCIDVAVCRPKSTNANTIGSIKNGFKDVINHAKAKNGDNSVLSSVKGPGDISDPRANAWDNQKFLPKVLSVDKRTEIKTCSASQSVSRQPQSDFPEKESSGAQTACERPSQELKETPNLEKKPIPESEGNNIHRSIEGAVSDIIDNFLRNGSTEVSIAVETVSDGAERFLSFTSDGVGGAAEEVLEFGLPSSTGDTSVNGVGYTFGHQGALGFLAKKGLLLGKQQVDSDGKTTFSLAYFDACAKDVIRTCLSWNSRDEVERDREALLSILASTPFQKIEDLLHQRDMIKTKSGFRVILFVSADRFDFSKTEDISVEGQEPEEVIWPKKSRKASKAKTAAKIEEPSSPKPAKKTSMREILSRKYLSRSCKIILCESEVQCYEWSRVLFKYTESEMLDRTLHLKIGFRLDRRPEQHQHYVPSEVFFYIRKRLVARKLLKAYLSLAPMTSQYMGGFTIVLDDESGILETNVAKDNVHESQALTNIRRKLRHIAIQVYRLMTSSAKLSGFLHRLNDLHPLDDSTATPQNPLVLDLKKPALVPKDQSKPADVIAFPKLSKKRSSQEKRKLPMGHTPSNAPAKTEGPSSRTRKRRLPRRYGNSGSASGDGPEHGFQAGSKGAKNIQNKNHSKNREMRKELLDIEKTIDEECFREYWREWEEVGRPDDDSWDDSIARGRVQSELNHWRKRLKESSNVRDFTQRLLELEESMLPAYHTDLWRGRKRAVKLWKLGVVAGRTRQQWLESSRRIKKFKEWQEFKQEFDFYSCREDGQVVNARGWLSRHGCEDSSSEDEDKKPRISSKARNPKRPRPEKQPPPNSSHGKRARNGEASAVTPKVAKVEVRSPMQTPFVQGTGNGGKPAGFIKTDHRNITPRAPAGKPMFASCNRTDPPFNVGREHRGDFKPGSTSRKQEGIVQVFQATATPGTLCTQVTKPGNGGRGRQINPAHGRGTPIRQQSSQNLYHGRHYVSGSNDSNGSMPYRVHRPLAPGPNSRTHTPAQSVRRVQGNSRPVGGSVVTATAIPASQIAQAWGFLHDKSRSRRCFECQRAHTKCEWLRHATRCLRCVQRGKSCMIPVPKNHPSSLTRTRSVPARSVSQKVQNVGPASYVVQNPQPGPRSLRPERMAQRAHSVQKAKIAETLNDRATTSSLQKGRINDGHKNVGTLQPRELSGSETARSRPKELSPISSEPLLPYTGNSPPPVYTDSDSEDNQMTVDR